MTKIIEIKGARANNLQGIDVRIPHGKITVITGVSGSGKSSLAFTTLFAEGQRRFIESMSSYVRQFLGKLDKPQVEYIKGLSPTIAIEQKVISGNPRSTVGTTTEIYDYLKLLFAREGKTYSPISGLEVTKDTPSEVLKQLQDRAIAFPFAILYPAQTHGPENLKKTFLSAEKEGFIRIYFNNKIALIHEVENWALNEPYHVVDRFRTLPTSDEETSRLLDSISTAFNRSNGTCTLLNLDSQEMWHFNHRFERDGMAFEEPSASFFAFNNPYGACKTCEGFGSVLGIDPNLVFPNPNLSVYEGAVHPWRGETMGEYLQQFLLNAHRIDFPVHTAYRDLSEDHKEILWKGNAHFDGLRAFFKHVEGQSYKIQYRVMLSRYRGKTTCPDCLGTRLRKDASYVKFQGKSLQELVLLPVQDLRSFFANCLEEIPLNKVLARLLPEIKQRLDFLCDVGLGYLTLNRATNTLSGGESQRIHLAKSLGSSLVGSTYILDEPSIGLHPRDTKNLIKVLQHLKNLGNTVVIVEHESAIMEAADFIIDIGPMAGIHGGLVTFSGKQTDFAKSTTLTAQYLRGEKRIPFRTVARKTSTEIVMENAAMHNLKKVNIRIPLQQLVCISGVSGSGKSTLMKSLFFPGLRQVLEDRNNTVYKGCIFSGDYQKIRGIEFIDQNPIGKSSRSNPITYLKAFDEIRDLYSRTPLAIRRDYKPGFFSFNVEGGRCEACQGEGIITVSMQFMADVQLTCESCKGSRYKDEALEVLYHGKSIADLLNMDLQTLHDFFDAIGDKKERSIARTIAPLLQVGLGYLKAGQSSSTLSGGEAQRIKLAYFLSKGSHQNPTLFLFDEPTTGLHFYDIEQLLIALYGLLDLGHSVVIIEHNLDVIARADYVIDLGPEGGDMGGQVVFEGSPEDLCKQANNYTGKALRRMNLLTPI
jgi:excinuclease ABC subunit A